MASKFTVSILLLLAVTCLGGALIAQTSSERSAAELMDALMWNREPIGGPFALIDQSGTPRTDAGFRGKLMLVYFGFTYCPNVCPTDLQEIGLAIDQLGPLGEIVQPIFITVDPARDTPEHLKEYLAFFHARFVGLTGNQMAIHAAARAYRVYYKKVEFTGASDYTVDHSAFIYLMGRDGQYLGFFPPGSTASLIAGNIRPRLTAQHPETTFAANRRRAIR